MKESNLVVTIRAYLCSHGCYAVKWHGSVYGAGAMPDIYALVPREPYWIPWHIEVKMPGNKPTPRQMQRLRVLRRSGAVAVWVDNLADVQYLLARLLGEYHVVLNEADFRVHRSDVVCYDT